MKVIVVCFIFFQSWIAQANFESCIKQMHDYAVRMATQNPACEDCEPRMVESLKGGPENTVLMVIWTSPKTFPLSEIIELQKRADRFNVNVLSDFSFQEPTGVGQMTSFVFSGNKSRILKLLKVIDPAGKTIVNFEILNDLTDGPKTQTSLIQAATHENREKTIRAAIAESKEKLLLINDVTSHAFFAAVSPSVFGDYHLLPSGLKGIKRSVTQTLGDLLSNWDENIGDVIRGRSDIFVAENGTRGIYLISLDELSGIQEQRAKDFAAMVDLNKKLNKALPPTEPPKATEEAVVSPRSNPGSEVISITTTDFVLHRAKVLFGSKSPAKLSIENPAILIRRGADPMYVAFSPEYLKKAPLKEVLPFYKHVAGIPENVYSARFVSVFFSQYRKGTLQKGTFKKYSLSELGVKDGFAALTKNFNSQNPIVVTQLVSEGNDDQMILVPVAPGWKIQPERME